MSWQAIDADARSLLLKGDPWSFAVDRISILRVTQPARLRKKQTKRQKRGARR